MVDLSSPEKVEEWLREGHWMHIRDIDHGKVDIELSCDGLTEVCRAWEMCMDHDCGYAEHVTGDPMEQVRHGVKHLWEIDRWTRPSDHCISELPIASDVYDRILMSRIGPGIYAVRVDWTERPDGDYVEVWW